MNGHVFDELVKRLGTGNVARRRALMVFGTAALAAVLPPLPPQPAEALTRRFRRQCRSVGGVPLKKGACHCALTCTTPSTAHFVCQNNNSCACNETVSGKGHCAQSLSPDVFGCSTNADCPTNTVCLMDRGCPPGTRCTSSGPCPPNQACIKGTCQRTFCLPPCPT